jgi:hypothetical protein
MKTITKFALLFSVASAFCFADTWSGKLIDSACKAKAQESGQAMPCSATKATSTFGIETPDGKVMSLDAEGNAKAADAIKNNKNPDPQVSVTGSLDAKGAIKVESINVQQ